MATATGRSDVAAYMAGIERKLVEKVLRGAGKAGGQVILDEAKLRSASDAVRDDLVMKTKVKDDRVIVRITVKPGWGYSVGLWAEYGTSPHFISVDDEQRGGDGLRRINKKVGEAGGDGSLVIGGKFVGKTVFHPGAQPHPFLRPALDIKGAEAVRAAQGYINAHVRPSGITGSEGDGE